MVAHLPLVFTQHARDRCAEMGISTKIGKRIWRNQCMTYPVTDTSWGTQATMVLSEVEPRYSLVVVITDEQAIAVTVAFRTDGPYIREGETFRRVTQEEYDEHRRSAVSKPS